MTTVIPICKPSGMTPLEAIEAYKYGHPEYREIPMTYAGRLDPLAEGVLLLLCGSAILEKEKYLALPKTYRAEILLGVSTDSYDVLGRVAKTGLVDVPENSVVEAAGGLAGELNLEVPPFSSVPVRGKPLFMWALEGKTSEIEIPKRAMKVSRIVYEGCKLFLGNEILEKALEKIQSVRGNFRQQECITSWQKAMEGKAEETFYVYTFEIDCSSGTYVRSLAVELGRRLGTPALLWRLTRTRIGQFEAADCTRL